MSSFRDGTLKLLEILQTFVIETKDAKDEAGLTSARERATDAIVALELDGEGVL